jgi:hypothetical protein
VSERAAQKRDLEHPRQPDVGDALAAIAQKTVVLLTRQRRAETLAVGYRSHARVAINA